MQPRRFDALLLLCGQAICLRLSPLRLRLSRGRGIACFRASPRDGGCNDRLFTYANPDRRNHLNPDSLTVQENCKPEPTVADAKVDDRIQFERLGYFCVDRVEPANQRGRIVFNRTVPLRDSWAKMKGK